MLDAPWGPSGMIPGRGRRAGRRRAGGADVARRQGYRETQFPTLRGVTGR